jgi:DNA end-binding protein Ku
MKLPAEMMKLAQHIIRSKAAKFDPSLLKDRYGAALMRILKEKQRKRALPAPAGALSRENVINLMNALRRSIAAQKDDARTVRKSGKR